MTFFFRPGSAIAAAAAERDDAMVFVRTRASIIVGARALPEAVLGGNVIGREPARRAR